MYYNEFAKSTVLQWALGVLLLNYFVVFHSWITYSITTVAARDSFAAVCPPYFQNCDIFYVLLALPLGYSQTFLYMLLFGGLLWAVYLMSQKKWREVQLLLIPYFLWHAWNVLFYTETLAGSLEYYLIGYGVILLLLPHKEFFLKLFVVVFYVLSTVSKIHPTWIEGSYFTNLQNGLPIFPEWSVPFWTNLVIVAEMVGAWFLMSRNRILQQGACIFFVVFHLYSGIFVEFRYPMMVLPMLLVLFGPWYSYNTVPLDRKSIAGWCFIALLIGAHVVPKFIVGDEKLTLEGNRYGLYMFEANHQCISKAVVQFTDGTQIIDRYVSGNARRRCNPYHFWYSYTEMCHRVPKIERIAWTHDHSINGRPFLRIVDTENVCDLTYKPFSHNEWIKTEADDPEVVGWPVRSYFDY